MSGCAADHRSPTGPAAVGAPTCGSSGLVPGKLVSLGGRHSYTRRGADAGHSPRPCPPNSEAGFLLGSLSADVRSFILRSGRFWLTPCRMAGLPGYSGEGNKVKNQTVVWGRSSQGGREEKPRFLKPQWPVGGGRIRGTRGGAAGRYPSCHHSGLWFSEPSSSLWFLRNFKIFY